MMTKSGAKKKAPVMDLDIDNLPTSTAHQARLRIFQATRRPQIIDGEPIVTAWGSVQMRGAKLGQGHADILESMLFFAKRSRIDGAGRLQLLVDPHDLRRVCSSGEQLQQSINNLMTAIITMVINNNGRGQRVRIDGHIIDDAVRTENLVPDPLNPGGPGRARIRVTFGEAWTRLMRADIRQWYDPLPISRLTTGIAQAVVRHILTHKTQPNGGWDLDSLIQTAGGKCEGQELRDRRRYVRSDALAMERCGVKIEGEKVFRIKNVGQTPDSVGQTPDFPPKRGPNARKNAVSSESSDYSEDSTAALDAPAVEEKTKPTNACKA